MKCMFIKTLKLDETTTTANIVLWQWYTTTFTGHFPKKYPKYDPNFTHYNCRFSSSLAK